MLVMVIEVVPLLVSVIAFPAPAPPTVTDPQLSDVGLALTDEFPLEELGAYPESATVCAVELAEVLMLRVAVSVPLVSGAKMMLAVQLADAARVDPQVFE
jgi:hypothetical protein